AGEGGLGDPVDGHDRAVVDEQHGQQAPLPRSAKVDLDAVPGDGQRTKCVELDHGLPIPRRCRTYWTATVPEPRGSPVATGSPGGGTVAPGGGAGGSGPPPPRP